MTTDLAVARRLAIGRQALGGQEPSALFAITVQAGEYRRARERADRERVILGGVIRHLWPELVAKRQVSELARTIGVGREFLYAVRDGKQWTA
jgi:hypothetical protein